MIVASKTTKYIDFIWSVFRVLRSSGAVSLPHKSVSWSRNTLFTQKTNSTKFVGSKSRLAFPIFYLRFLADRFIFHFQTFEIFVYQTNRSVWKWKTPRCTVFCTYTVLETSIQLNLPKLPHKLQLSSTYFRSISTFNWRLSW